MKMPHSTTTLALLFGTGLALGAAPANAQLFVCDANDDGSVTMEEANTCADRRFTEVTGGAQGMDEDQFAGAYSTEPDPNLFQQVDEDGDGMLSADEWKQWHEQAFETATKGTGGEMPAEQYESGAWMSAVPEEGESG